MTKEVTLTGHYNGATKDPWGNMRAGFSAEGSSTGKISAWSGTSRWIAAGSSSATRFRYGWILNVSRRNLNRLLKKALNFVLGSSQSSTHPRGYASGVTPLRPRWMTF